MATSCNGSEQASLVGLSFGSHSLVSRPVLSGDYSTEENTSMLLKFQACKSAKIGNERIAAANLGGDSLSRARQAIVRVDYFRKKYKKAPSTPHQRLFISSLSFFSSPHSVFSL